jgi:cytochrome bd-type quinol oxidase subunit 2
MQLVLLFCIVASGTVTNFFPTVVNTLQEGALSEASRDSSVISLLLTAPPYVLAVIVTYLNALHADKTGERYWHITIPMCVAVVAYIIAATTTHIAPRYLSMMLMVSLPPMPLSSSPFPYSSFPCLFPPFPPPPITN